MRFQPVIKAWNNQADSEGKQCDRSLGIGDLNVRNMWIYFKKYDYSR